MGIRKKRCSLLLTYLVSLLSLVICPNVKALEVVISDNGPSGSSVVINQTTDVQVTQSNEAQVENNVSQEANTGDNIISGNVAENVNVNTGDISTNQEITNNLNDSSVDTQCCATSSDTIEVSGNGDGSVNNFELIRKTQVNIEVKNSASINDSVVGSANTGKNSASDNTGSNIGIRTGNITIQNEIINAPINRSRIKIQKDFFDYKLAVSNNGFGSVNIISCNISENNNFSIDNFLKMNNFFSWDANTGENNVLGNTDGLIDILTGDIFISTFVDNLANVQDVEIQCVRDADPGEDEETVDDGRGGNTDPGDNNSSSDGSSNDSQGSILPSAAATEAGGPGIFGLSDTSSGVASNILFFWLSLIFITAGGKLIFDSLLFGTSNRKD